MKILRAMAKAVLLLAFCSYRVNGFTAPLVQRTPLQHRNKISQPKDAPNMTNVPLVGLRMSSIPSDEDNDSKKEGLAKKPLTWWFDDMVTLFSKNLPPLPENQLFFYGDIAWLFFYSFLDHVLHDIYVASTVNVEPDIVGIHASWIDAMHKPAEFVAVSYSMVEQYSPALASAGICGVLFSTLWLLSGYFHRSFSFKNTIECDPGTAMIIAAKTWVGAAAGMLTLAYLSDAMAMSGLQNQVGGLTRSDLDFVVDTLPVMVTWRWMIPWILSRF